MLVSKAPIARLVATISLLSMPISGRSTGRGCTSSVQARARRVWLATWARLSPVTMAWQSMLWAIWWAIRSMLRRISTVNSGAGPWSRMYSWGSV